MKTFYSDDESCLECGFIGGPEIVFEFQHALDTDLEKENIISLCPMCGRSAIRGERINGEEFYY